MSAPMQKQTDNTPELDQLCINTIRTLSLDAVQKAESGHPGLPLGAAPMAYVLWTRFYRHNPKNPKWENRDRFLLSAGQIPLSLWLVACVVVEIDGTRARRFVKWRWNKQSDIAFQHDGHPCNARIQFSGANQIHCRLLVDGVAVGESNVPAKGFGIGLITVAVATAIAVRNFLGMKISF